MASTVRRVGGAIAKSDGSLRRQICFTDLAARFNGITRRVGLQPDQRCAGLTYGSLGHQIGIGGRHETSDIVSAQTFVSAAARKLERT